MVLLHWWRQRSTLRLTGSTVAVQAQYWYSGLRCGLKFINAIEAQRELLKHFDLDILLKVSRFLGFRRKLCIKLPSLSKKHMLDYSQTREENKAKPASLFVVTTGGKLSSIRVAHVLLTATGWLIVQWYSQRMTCWTGLEENVLLPSTFTMAGTTLLLAILSTSSCQHAAHMSQAPSENRMSRNFYGSISLLHKYNSLRAGRR